MFGDVISCAVMVTGWHIYHLDQQNGSVCLTSQPEHIDWLNLQTGKIECWEDRVS